MINIHDLLYAISKTYTRRFFLNLEGLSDGKLVSLTKKEYGFAVYFIQIFIKSLTSTSDE